MKYWLILQLRAKVDCLCRPAQVFRYFPVSYTLTLPTMKRFLARLHTFSFAWQVRTVFDTHRSTAHPVLAMDSGNRDKRERPRLIASVHLPSVLFSSIFLRKRCGGCTSPSKGARSLCNMRSQ